MLTHPRVTAIFRLLLAGFPLMALAAADPPATPRRGQPQSRPRTGAPQPQPQREVKPLDPRGRMDDHPTNKPARFYVWHDRDGWHLRSCSRVANKFEGTLRLDGGSFRKIRPIGIDQQGRLADQWQLNKDRNELKFVMNTGPSFDGFDFTVDKADAELEFELLINGKPMPARVFLGRYGEHPREAKFQLPADPEQLDGEDAPVRAAGNQAGSSSEPAAPAPPAARPRSR